MDKSRMVRKIKKIIKYVLVLSAMFVLYVCLGIIISYSRQPKIDRDFEGNFDIESFYSDISSPDRACIIEDNLEALEIRLRMIREARERIILSTFDFRSDESGKTMLSALLDAAERGVEVKVLVDGFPAMSHMDGDEYFEALSTHENAEIKIYNRVNILFPWRSMGRLHDKYLLVDDYMYLLGGRNTYDYFLGNIGYRNYDRDVFVYSTESNSRECSIGQIEEYFDSVWFLRICDYFHDNPEGAEEKDVIRAREELEDRYKRLMENYSKENEESYHEMTVPVDKITLLSNPIHVYSKKPTVFYSLLELLKSADGGVRIHTPYIICNDWMYESFRELCKANQDVALMTNSAANNGNPFGASDYLSNKDELIETGLNIYEYEGGISYHGKSITAGDSLSIIGSFNMDMRSTYLDTELMLVIDSKELNSQLNAYMSSYERESVRVIDEENYDVPDGVIRQKMSSGKKFLTGILRCFGWLRFLM